MRQLFFWIPSIANFECVGWVEITIWSEHILVGTEEVDNFRLDDNIGTTKKALKCLDLCCSALFHQKIMGKYVDTCLKEITPKFERHRNRSWVNESRQCYPNLFTFTERHSYRLCAAASWAVKCMAWRTAAESLAGQTVPPGSAGWRHSLASSPQMAGPAAPHRPPAAGDQTPRVCIFGLTISIQPD